MISNSRLQKREILNFFQPQPQEDHSMRQVFADSSDYTDRAAVENEYPWAAEIIEADGGWQVFESADDAQIWQNQN